MRSLVRRPAALGAALLVLAAAVAFAVPTCGDTPEPVRPIVLDGGDQGDAPEEEGSDGRHTTSTSLRAAMRAKRMIET
jgi:hypothetical protein